MFWALDKFHYMREHLEIIESTQVKDLLGKISIVRQSAGNQRSLINTDIMGSSETIRETLDNQHTHDLSFDFVFRNWFIGFTEGDGSFIVNKSGWLEFKIRQSSNDAQVLFYIKKKLGFGSVTIQCKQSKTHHYRVRDKKGLLTLIYIFNGCLYTKKKNCQFVKWVNAFNNAYNTNINIIQRKNIFTLKNAWLAGFTDAEGCFTCTIIKRSENYNQVQVRYILSQKDELELFTEINSLINGKLLYLKSYAGYNLTVNFSKLSKVIRYFNVYSLKTKKNVAYLNWLKVYKSVRNKEHFSPDGLVKIQNLISKINK